MALPEVRSDVASNLSTTTCSLPPEPFAISFNRAAIRSRPPPIPRFGWLPDARATYPALWTAPRRKRKPRPARDQLLDQPAHRLFVHILPRHGARRTRRR